MKRIVKVFLPLLLCCIFAFGFLAGCKPPQEDVGLDDEGNIIIRPGSKVPTVVFWGYGDQVELDVFTKLTDQFNKLHKDQIKVNYIQKASTGYGEAMRVTLGGNSGPDVLYVGDADFKAVADYGYLEPLDNYIAKSEEIVLEEMWETSLDRYKYDVKTATFDGPGAKIWAVPKDIGPTVIYYNETFFNDANISVISVGAQDLTAFNAGQSDSRGKTKAQYGIDFEVKEKGYFVNGSKRFFNNQIPMSWDETVACANRIQEVKVSPKVYGFYTEWWFNYGWTVGGDCVEYIPAPADPAYNGGYYDFTLMDSTKNYIVADNALSGFTINGNKYEPGEIISYQDKLVSLTAASKTISPQILGAVETVLNELPSQREAFVEFIRIGQLSNKQVEPGVYGYGITPSPTSIGGDAAKTRAFSQGSVAMLVDGRWNVPNFRNEMDGKYEWDVAPLPIYKEYDANGNIKVHGRKAGHSGSVALVINSRSSLKNASWLFLEYIGGRTGQTEQAKSGFAIPSQKDIADSEVFLQPDKNPKNAGIFIDAARHQTPGDWWYLRDKQWIDPWAGKLNGSVRNGNMTLTEFENCVEFKNTFEMLKGYTKK
ncbi:MAG: extracellular solute-binding protein [Clostridiales bacterium]|jgi:multiple sugar transport system substrate-binding protein|nr:extracellular solute-binding protein [Clostridiales bacterium]